jgi:hypothetical protein
VSTSLLPARPMPLCAASMMLPRWDYNAFMVDAHLRDPRPRELPPSTCVLEQSSEHTQKLPRQFGVGGDDLYSGTAVF